MPNRGGAIQDEPGKVRLGGHLCRWPSLRIGSLGRGEACDKGAPGALRKESGGEGTGMGMFSFWQEEPPKGFTQELAGTGLPSKAPWWQCRGWMKGKGPEGRATEPLGSSYFHG